MLGIPLETVRALRSATSRSSLLRAALRLTAKSKSCTLWAWTRS